MRIVKASRHLASRASTLAALCAFWIASPFGAAHAQDDPASRHVYPTGGVHNDVGCNPPSSCIYQRKPGEPTNPLYPAWWSSQWTMYRVFQNYDKFPPPYASPPEGLTPGDYQVSYGATYYDSTYVPRDRDGTGAMMEFYDKFCLPIFPIPNNFTCAFVSLGNKAYFLRYADRPAGTPECCQFSLKNHPPRRDFIKHLPYNPKESNHVGNSLQAYSYVVAPNPPGILFGYAFNKTPTPDSYNKKAAPYRHPQSFYFSGYYTGNPNDPPNAPIVSQNYSSFRMEKPDPAKTWGQVAKMCPAKPQWCCLFASDCPGPQALEAKPAADWSRIRPQGAGR